MKQFTYADENFFRNKIILVTGAAGFIGAHLTDWLCEAGADVYGTSRVERHSDKVNMHWVQGTLDDFNFSKNLLQNIKPKIIFHLAGEVTAANDLKFVLPTYHSLLTSTVNLLSLATELGCDRIVLTGSSTEPLDEHPIPNSPYSATKWATNGYGKMFADLYKTPVVIARPFMGYGPGQPNYKLIPYIILSLLKNEMPKLSNGLWITDWVYINDTVKGILSCAAAPAIEGETIDLGSGVLTSVRQIIEKIIHLIQPAQRPLFGTLPDRHMEHTRVAETSSTLTKINWKAETSLDRGLEQTIDWFRKNTCLP